MKTLQRPRTRTRTRTMNSFATILTLFWSANVLLVCHLSSLTSAYQITTRSDSRRQFLQSTFLATFVVGSGGGSILLPTAATAAVAVDSTSSSATITDKIYLDIKGIAPNEPPQRIVIGLFGNDAPDATNKLKQLVTKQGLPSPCKPKDTSRLLQKEQLEANKVYNSCKEYEDTKGVNYDLSTIWRVIQDDRIDVGAVSGKFISRENVQWEGSNDLKHDAFGVVSVKRGNDSGFGFTIYPGTSSGTATTNLDETHIVVGRVIDGLEVIQQINQVPVVKSAKLGGGEQKSAPSRACRYGSNELYCNENKPLQKLSIYNSGIL